MKQIPLLQGKALLIELPEGQQPMGLWRIEPNRLFYVDQNGCDTNMVLPEGNWRIIGMLGEVTEGQAANIVDSYSIPRHPDFMRYDNQKFTDSALESLESSILAEGWKFHNPYKKPDYIPKTMTAEFAYREEMDDWEKAESRVLCRERCLLLGREI